MNPEQLIIALLNEIAELESQRDKAGRHTNVSGHFEMLMNKHEELFAMFKVTQLPSKNAT